jgi:hypothetical protein
MNNHYKGTIWTNHALNRLRDRKISQSEAWAAWSRPDKSRYIKSKDAWIYERTYNTIKITIIAKKNDNNEWIIISVWSKPVRPHRITGFWEMIKSAVKKLT